MGIKVCNKNVCRGIDLISFLSSYVFVYAWSVNEHLYVLSFYDVSKLIKYASEVALYICNKVIFGGVSLKVASL